MIVSNCSVPLLGIVDTALLGHLESPIFLGAVAVGSSIMTFVLWTFGFLRMGTTSETAHAFGRSDLPACARLLLQSSLLAIAIALALMLLSPLLVHTSIYLISPSAAIADLGMGYTTIRILSAPATLITYVIIGWFIGVQNTRAPLLITLFVNVFNIALDWIFIVVLAMNSDGAALATVIAEYLGLVLALLLVFKVARHKGISIQLNVGIRDLLTASGALLRVHGHLLLRTLCLLFAFAFFTAQGARQGDIVLAANAILLQLLALVSYGLDGYAHAAEALIGRTCGARDRENFYRAAMFTAQWSLWTALAFTVVFFFGRDAIISLFTNLDAVKSAAAIYYPWLVALPLIGFVSYWLDGVFIGARKTEAMRNTIVLACFGVYLPLWWAAPNFSWLGFSPESVNNHGLWLAFSGFLVARGLIMTYYFFQFEREKRWFV